MAGTGAPNRKVVILNVRVFDSERITGPKTVVIDGNLIGNEPEGADETIDADNGVLIPGLIDAHIHVQREDELRQMAAWGVTTGLGMGEWPPETLHRLRGGEGMTDIRSPGVPATCSGSLHSKIMPFNAEDHVNKPGDATAFVRSRVDEGADYIKIIADVPGPDQATLHALVSAAHECNKLVIAHAASCTPFDMAQEAGADIVTHVPMNDILGDAVVNRMVASKQVAVPTLTIMEGMAKPRTWISFVTLLLIRPLLMLSIISAKWQSPDKGAPDYANCKGSVTAMYHAGVPVLAGTDANGNKGSPFFIKHGEALHRELELLVGAGMSTIDALRAATVRPAKHFGLVDRGVIEVGKRADLVLLADDPLEDIRATRSIQRVWCGGVEVKFERT